VPRFAVILAAAVMAVAVTAQAKQFDVTRLDVDLRVTTEAAYELTERYGYAFSGGSYSYLSRTIPKEHIDALHDVAVTSPDVTIEDVTLAEENGAWRIRWTFPSRAEPTRFTVRYTVEGALFATDERNVLDWNVVGTQWPVPVRDIAARTAKLVEFDRPLEPEEIVLLRDYAYPVYGVPSDETNQAIRLCARLEGMMTDPVYEGKSMQGLIDLVRRGFFPPRSKVLYAHLGGVPAINAYSYLYRDG